jgi:hypothetical protein
MTEFVSIESYTNIPFVASCITQPCIRTPQDFLDLLAWGNENNTNLFLMNDVNFVSEFYDLKSGLAGEMLQKLSNYCARLAIVGNFNMVVSDRFRELMFESNKGSQIHFAHSRDEAISWLSGNKV